jgi:hypothetical protein
MLNVKKYCQSIVALLLFYQCGVYAQSVRQYILLCGNLRLVVAIRDMCVLIDSLNVYIEILRLDNFVRFP